MSATVPKFETEAVPLVDCSISIFMRVMGARQHPGVVVYAGDNLTALLEPANPVNPQAVAILVNGEPIGHLKIKFEATDGSTMFSLMTAPVTPFDSMTLTAIDPSSTAFNSSVNVGFRIRVTVKFSSQAHMTAMVTHLGSIGYAINPVA